MPIDPQIAVESSLVRTAWITPQPPAPAARLPWTGFKAADQATFFRQLYTHVKAQKGPICHTTTTQSNLDYAGWFNYFFNEAKGAAEGNDAIEQNFGRITSLMFDLEVEGAGAGAKIKFQGAFPLPVSPTFMARLAHSPGAIPKSILAYLFELGFLEATMTTAGDYFGMTLALKSNLTDGVAVRSSKGTFVFAYRGDTRDVATIIRQGAKCRAELDFWRDDAHVNEAWHPWSDADTKWKKMWFRRGAKDNDYFTLNSLAKEFHISCAYPMFRSFEINQDMVGPAAGWTPLQCSRLAAKNIVIRDVYDKTTASWQKVPSDETRVFACAISSSTEAAKTLELNNYPESAVRNVELEDMIAWVKVRRYHRPPASALEHYDSTRISPSMTIKVMTWGWVRTEDETRASLGCTPDGIKVIAAKLENLKGKVFDISHTAYFPAATYDVDRQRVVGPAPAPVRPGSQPVRLTNR